ncbi:unnamed protein product, partial [Brassica napus]
IDCLIRGGVGIGKCLIAKGFLNCIYVPNLITFKVIQTIDICLYIGVCNT